MMQIAKPRFWTRLNKRAVLYQAITLGGVGLLLYFTATTTIANLQERGAVSGFDFLFDEAGFGIGFSLIDFEDSDPIAKAFLVGVINTFIASFMGIVLATVIGFGVGLARLSSNRLISWIALVYVEAVRNVPLLLHIIVWYWVLQQLLPPIKQSFSFLDIVFLNNRGAYFPVLTFEDGSEWIMAGGVAAIVFVIAFAHWAKRRQNATGNALAVAPICAGVLIGIPAAATVATGFPVGLEVPVLRGFNFQGGVSLIPELGALVIGLAVYNGAFIAEIVRGSIEAISQSQKDSATALGFRYGLKMRLVVVPLSLRIMVPPMTNQYLHLLKGSSLAVAIGYPDLVSIFTGSVLNNTGRAIEVMVITMAVYLLMSAAVAVLMNWYNRRVALVVR